MHVEDGKVENRETSREEVEEKARGVDEDMLLAEKALAKVCGWPSWTAYGWPS